MTHTLRSTPTSGIEAVLGITPLDLYIQAQCNKVKMENKVLSPGYLGWCGNLSRRRGHRFVVIKYSIDSIE
ncbi:Uncharacterized protein FKW44_004731 [Caligus rogercresseyi]|uniref:Uncharacterized protein n=1 Tax=Caligus rogercresseyi TaxID=217165 RepID=A0A7T8HMC3_CALRO|nr:Uncharacterized protein FKW44_004731 [Caligus rogercresseyi]